MEGCVHVLTQIWVFNSELENLKLRVLPTLAYLPCLAAVQSLADSSMD